MVSLSLCVFCKCFLRFWVYISTNYTVYIMCAYFPIVGALYLKLSGQPELWMGQSLNGGAEEKWNNWNELKVKTITIWNSTVDHIYVLWNSAMPFFMCLRSYRSYQAHRIPFFQPPNSIIHTRARKKKEEGNIDRWPAVIFHAYIYTHIKWELIFDNKLPNNMKCK